MLVVGWAFLSYGDLFFLDGESADVGSFVGFLLYGLGGGWVVSAPAVADSELGETALPSFHVFPMRLFVIL